MKKHYKTANRKIVSVKNKTAKVKKLLKKNKFNAKKRPKTDKKNSTSHKTRSVNAGSAKWRHADYICRDSCKNKQKKDECYDSCMSRRGFETFGTTLVGVGATVLGREMWDAWGRRRRRE